MPAKQTQNQFRAAALADGLELLPAPSLPALNWSGHFGLPERAGAVVTAMAAILAALDGDAAAIEANGVRALEGDFVHAPTGIFIEVDELQHFTNHRLTTLGLYPPSAPLGFDLARYRDLCRVHSAKADRQYARKPGAGFGPHGRGRKRAYNDALRDLAIPALGHPPIIRIPAIEVDGATAYRATRDKLRDALGAP